MCEVTSFLLMADEKKARKQINYTPKVKFSSEEDARLLKAVKQYGTCHWKLIAQMLDGRNARQCRERWANYLNPDIAQKEWTPEEEALLMQKYNQLGPKWHSIAYYFKKRSTNQIKNRYAVMKRRMTKEERKAMKTKCKPIETEEFKQSEKVSMGVTEKGREIIKKSRTDTINYLDHLISNTTVSWVSENNVNGVNDDFFNPFIL